MLAQGDLCLASYSVSGLDGQGHFVYLFSYEEDGLPHFHGYIPLEACQLEII